MQAAWATHAEATARLHAKLAGEAVGGGQAGRGEEGVGAEAGEEAAAEARGAGVTFDAWREALRAACAPRWVDQPSEVVGLPLLPMAWCVGLTEQQAARAFVLPTALLAPRRRAALDLPRFQVG